MQDQIFNEDKITAKRLRPVVIVVVAAKLAVSGLLLATVDHSPPAPEIVALR